MGLACLSMTAQNSVIERLKTDFERGKTLSMAYLEALPKPI